MTVRELLEALQALSPDLLDAEVLVSADSEGNRFELLSDVATDIATKYGWEWELRDPDELDEDDDVQDVVVLWP